MLSRREQEIWDEIDRRYGPEADRVARSRVAEVANGWRPRRLDEAPGIFAVGLWVAVFLVLFGATVAGPAVGAGTAVGLLLWRFRPHRDGVGRAGAQRITASMRSGWER
ncbi:hypothetical protein [Geodermatophilus sp. URMC 64]